MSTTMLKSIDVVGVSEKWLQILDEVRLADAVPPADLVECGNEVVPLHLLAVDGDGVAGFKAHLDKFRLVAPC